MIILSKLMLGMIWAMNHQKESKQSLMYTMIAMKKMMKLL